MIKNAIEKRRDQIFNHLSYLGYKVRKPSNDNPNAFLAEHSLKPTLSGTIRDFGVLLRIYFRIRPEVLENLSRLLELINSMNQEFLLARVYVDDDKDWTFEACYIGEHNKIRFSEYLTIVEADYSRTKKYGLRKYLQ